MVRLVLGIARLGESDLRGWWHGHALNSTGGYVLSGMFKRTWRAAALEMDIAAALRIHNEVLGRVNAVHLFSDQLPFRRWAAGWLAEQKTAPETDELFTQLEGWTSEDAGTAIRGWLGPVESAPRKTMGKGLLLGRLSVVELADPAVQERTARLLVDAYLEQREEFMPPYFDVAR